MISTVVMFILILGLIFILPGKYMLLTSLYISVCIILWDSSQKKMNWANIVVVVVNIIVCTLFYIAGFRNFLPFIGSFFYSAIAVLAFGTLLFGKPFTLANKKPNDGELVFHKIFCFIIGVMNLIALLMSVVLIPHVLYIILPLFLSFSSIIVGVKISTIIQGKFFKEKITS